MKIDGRCHCGAIRYEAEIDPERVSICHCTDCQMLTGSAYRVSVPAPRESLHLAGKVPKVYVKIADSGRRRLQYFCPDCGSPLFATGEGDEAGQCGIRWGTIRQRADLVPRRQIWCRSAVAWAGDIGELPGHDTE